MVIFVPGTEETDQKKQNMSLQQLGAATTALQASSATNTADIATINSTLTNKVTGPSSATDNALVRYDGTTGKLVQNSDVTLGDTDGKFSRAAGISIPGTNTNDSASAGYVGEYVSSNVASGSAVSATSNVTFNITSISLTAGDWDVWGNVAVLPAGGTSTTTVVAGVSTTSATEPTSPNGGAKVILQLPFTTGTTQLIPVGMGRLSVASTTTVYLVASIVFSGSTNSAYGFIGARRVR